MSETVNCPACNEPGLKTWLNKRRQLVGKCKGCRKLVRVGKPKSDEGGGKEESASKAKQQPAKKQAAKPASGAGGNKRPKAAGDGKPRRAAGGPKRIGGPVPKETVVPPPFGKFLKDFFGF
jgi:hypothetical protein